MQCSISSSADCINMHVTSLAIVCDWNDCEFQTINWEGHSHKTVSTNRNLFEEKGEPKRSRTEALLLTSLFMSQVNMMLNVHRNHKAY